MPNQIVAVHFVESGAPTYAHERVTLSVVAKAIANLVQGEFVGCYVRGLHAGQRPFLVPDDTVLQHEAAFLGLTCPRDLFGGVAPYLFVKTKAITHPLVAPLSSRPEGWRDGFPDRLRDAVLPGYTAFSREDARNAATQLFKRGAIRLKDPMGDSGKRQTTVANVGELERCLADYPTEHLAAHGLVLETNLNAPTTLSIGHIMVGDMMLAYCGAQETVANNAGQYVYGGSHLVCARGGWDALDELPVRPEMRLAIAQARAYDDATTEYPGFFASRRNYDVAQGFDDLGQWRSGVLEASWRSGGASTAELAALTEFVRDPALQVVEASAVKRFGRTCDPPPSSVVHFHGDDPEDGPLLRYTLVTGLFARHQPHTAPQRIKRALAVLRRVN